MQEHGRIGARLYRVIKVLRGNLSRVNILTSLTTESLSATLVRSSTVGVFMTALLQSYAAV
jgi:hypothetical protein